jgi:hypothetical protein
MDGVENIGTVGCAFDTVGGNAPFLSQPAWHTRIINNVFSHTGDTAIALVGSTKLMDGTGNTFVAHTNVTNNLIYEVGFYGKRENRIDTISVCTVSSIVFFLVCFKHKTESGAFFKSISYKTNLVNIVIFGGPRAGVNYNDGLMGGDLMEKKSALLQFCPGGP